MPPKSEKLQREEDAKQGSSKAPSALTILDESQPKGPVQIREVPCLNDFVAILQFEIESTIEIPDADSKYKNEGIVVGIGPGISDGAGGRLPLQIGIGDVVMFGRNIVATIASDSPPYAGHKVVIVSERNLLCKLHKQMEWEKYEGD